MNLHIELSGELEAALKAHAEARGVSAEHYAYDLFQQLLLEDGPDSGPRPMRRTGRGVLAQYGPGPSAAEIDEARKEMWSNFPRDLD